MPVCLQGKPIFVIPPLLAILLSLIDSLFGSRVNRLHKLAIDDHLLGEAAVDALFLVHVELLRIERLDAVVEALRTCVEKEACRRLEIYEPVVGGCVHILLMSFLINL